MILTLQKVEISRKSRASEAPRTKLISYKITLQNRVYHVSRFASNSSELDQCLYKTMYTTFLLTFLILLRMYFSCIQYCM